MSFKLHNGVTPAEFKKSLKQTFIIGCWLTIGSIAFTGLAGVIGTIGAVTASSEQAAAPSPYFIDPTQAIADYEFALEHGSTMDHCVAAGIVVAVFQHNRDAEEFKFWKNIEESRCYIAS